jgi:hypothetical protein
VGIGQLVSCVLSVGAGLGAAAGSVAFGAEEAALSGLDDGTGAGAKLPDGHRRHARSATSRALEPRAGRHRTADFSTLNV